VTGFPRATMPKCVGVIAGVGVLTVSLIVGLYAAGLIGPEIRVDHVGARTLLTHRLSLASAGVALSGPVGTNSRGCITVGGSVVILPVGSLVSEDGSVWILCSLLLGRLRTGCSPRSLPGSTGVRSTIRDLRLLIDVVVSR
jgi:hypothetical protein